MDLPSLFCFIIHDNLPFMGIGICEYPDLLNNKDNCQLSKAFLTTYCLFIVEATPEMDRRNDYHHYISIGCPIRGIKPINISLLGPIWCIFIRPTYSNSLCFLNTCQGEIFKGHFCFWVYQYVFNNEIFLFRNSKQVFVPSFFPRYC